MLEHAFADATGGGLTEEDWKHTLGGMHVFACDQSGGTVVSHAAVIARVLIAEGRPIRTGYVEAVATSPRHRHRGYASTVMREAASLIHAGYELGALATGLPDFYMSLGWELWRGPTWAGSPAGPRRTPDEDGAVMVLRTVASAHLDTTGPLEGDWRPGDVW
ncbi:MAG: aminoglycoside 2-N-acetyltransferase [Actinomycetota bacterium]|jgi:aminoglycoside 2'-N-acetyltransferase I|nr:aminoglycoside 2-N-acetyltransferase [Actinomycetota bacterium]